MDRFLEKFNLPRLNQEEIEIVNSNNKKEIATDITETQRIIQEYYELFAHKMDNLEEMDRFLEKFNLPRLTRKKQKL